MPSVEERLEALEGLVQDISKERLPRYLTRAFVSEEPPAANQVYQWNDTNKKWRPVAMDAPTVVRKTADETVNNSDALQNDDDLLFAMTASTTYEIELLLLISSNATADFKMAFTLPAGADMIWFLPATATLASEGSTAEGISITGTTVEGYLIRGIVRCDTTAGNLQLQWAQNTATVVDTIVYANSALKYWKR